MMIQQAYVNCRKVSFENSLMAMRGNQKGVHVVCVGIVNQALVWKYSFIDLS